MVCKNCCKQDKYALLTKTESKQDYLLTDREVERLPCWMKPNKYGNNPMKLYLRMHVEELAIEKHKSLELMDQEFELRQAKLAKRKHNAFERKLKDLRKRTRIKYTPDVDCSHDYQAENSIMKCKICGLTVEYESI
jgi:DNA-repair protein complementing XP-A cells